MDASQRWETEALRSGSLSRKTPPRPSSKQGDDVRPTDNTDSDTNWVTLKEAEAATGIPSNTVRKWVRKDAIPSFLESDGDTKLRMVDLDAVVSHAHDLGRKVTPLPAREADVVETSSPDPEPELVAEEDDTSEEEPPAPADAVEQADEAAEDDQDAADEEPEADDNGIQSDPEDEAGKERYDDEGDEAELASDEEDDVASGPPVPPEGTLIVPLDAWNKMLNQLGNLHEAGQQLAEARERAAKAETEAAFLRERLAEIRAQESEARGQTPDARGQTPDSRDQAQEAVDPEPAVEAEEAPETEQGDDAKATTSYWRYLTFGWRDRKKR